MRLVLDQNISFRLIPRLTDLCEHACHVKNLGLIDADDRDIWTYAREHGLSIVTFDSDFYDLSLIWGSPPKIIWLQTNDQRSDNVELMLRQNAETIRAFIERSDLSCLEILG